MHIGVNFRFNFKRLLSLAVALIYVGSCRGCNPFFLFDSVHSSMYPVMGIPPDVQAKMNACTAAVTITSVTGLPFGPVTITWTPWALATRYTIVLAYMVGNPSSPAFGSVWNIKIDIDPPAISVTLPVDKQSLSNVMQIWQNTGFMAAFVYPRADGVDGDACEAEKDFAPSPLSASVKLKPTVTKAKVTCQGGQYLDSKTGQCASCPAGQTFDVKAGQCNIPPQTSCPQTAQLVNGQCVPCPTGKLVNNQGMCVYPECSSPVQDRNQTTGVCSCSAKKCAASISGGYCTAQGQCVQGKP